MPTVSEEYSGTDGLYRVGLVGNSTRNTDFDIW